MNETPDSLHSQTVGGEDCETSREVAESPQSPTSLGRRELIERYAKYAVVGAPLLLFASKAHAIHSRP